MTLRKLLIPTNSQHLRLTEFSTIVYIESSQKCVFSNQTYFEMQSLSRLESRIDSMLCMEAPNPRRVNEKHFAISHWHLLGTGGSESAAPWFLPIHEFW
jgi:hypothetical protein